MMAQSRSLGSPVCLVFGGRRRSPHGYAEADWTPGHRTYTGSVERAERYVSLSTREVLATALGVTVPRLLTKGSAT
jgi:hypothetical protein